MVQADRQTDACTTIRAMLLTNETIGESFNGLTNRYHGDLCYALLDAFDDIVLPM